MVFAWDMHDAEYSPQPTSFNDSFGDILAVIDTKTLRKVPWDNNRPHFLVDFLDPITLEPLPFCPRSLLKKSIANLNQKGFYPKSGMELEFFNFKETPDTLYEKSGHKLVPLSTGRFGYSLIRPQMYRDYFNAIASQCVAYNIPLECFHTESGPGVYEAAIEYADSLELADRAHLFKTAAKQIGLEHGVIPCFMAKPYFDQPGCSGHLHFSLVDDKGTNLFTNYENIDKGLAQSNDPESFVTDTLRYFVAGVLHGLPSMMAIFAPNINSYKRLVENYWAPVTVSYGFEHRQTSIRIISPPTCSKKATRIEVRVPGADVNPYLANAAILACGLYGIENKLDAPVPLTGPRENASKNPRLARSLQDAVTKMMEPESLARKLLGDKFVEHYGATRLSEVKRWTTAVTDYEIKRYMETA